MKWKLTLAFDGTDYHGWQAQRSGLGVQDRVEAALARLFPSTPAVVSSSRTDAGVHAWGMVVHFEIPAEEFRMEPRHLPLAVNALLPESIRVRSAQRVAEDFHARFDAVAKEYRYRIWNHPAMHPLLRQQAWHVPRTLDLAAMRQAARLLTGRHDFRAFTSNRGGTLNDSHRTLHRCVVKRGGSELTVLLDGPGFLYKMCRGIVGTLVQVGEGRFPPEAVADMLASGDRRHSGMNAPAHGLVLWRVRY
jgi:tRNA pseudouridine38-40 synthase